MFYWETVTPKMHMDCAYCKKPIRILRLCSMHYDGNFRHITAYCGETCAVDALKEAIKQAKRKGG